MRKKRDARGFCRWYSDWILVRSKTSRQFLEVSRKVSGNLESFHSKVSGKFPEKFGNSERKKLERNKEIYA